VQSRAQGVGSMQVAMLDQLQLLDEARFLQTLKLEVTHSA
jgi:hypothetical protein